MANKEKYNRQDGSALIVVVLATFGVALVGGSVLNYMVTERRLNREMEYAMEARYAAEAAVEYGTGQLVQRFNANISLPADALDPDGGQPLTLDAGFRMALKGGNGPASSVLLADPYDPTLAWGTYDTEVIGGIIPPHVFKVVGRKKVYSRGVRIFGRATVETPQGRRIEARVMQELQVEDAPLFAHAVFYNMDMEIAPGPEMNIVGPVHANGNMYIQANSAINFKSDVTAVGKILHGRHPESGMDASNGTVTFFDGFEQKSMQDGSNWIDHLLSNWREMASNRWRNNVRDSAHSVQPHNPVAIKDYVADDPDTPAANDALNYGYQLIQPPENTNSSNYNPGIEEQKFSIKAGLIIKVTPDALDPTIPDVGIYIYDRDASGNIVYDTSGNPRRIEMTYDGDLTNIIKVDAFSSTTDNNGNEVISGGMRDARQNTALDLVTFNMGEFYDALHNSNVQRDFSVDPESWYNGIIYVEFPVSPTARKDGVRVTTKTDWAVMIENAEELPAPNFWGGEGLTFATNNQLYVRGHYNADGRKTGSETAPDNKGGGSGSDGHPSALIADAVTLLSPDWDPTKSGNGDWGARKANTFTEVDAAILTGLVPSGKNGTSYSGGVENFPRFLEDWDGTELRYRGSLVSLYESEVAKQPWIGGQPVYTPPTRSWGFNQFFAEGRYPPGTPNTRTFYRTNFRRLSETEWQSELAALAQEFKGNSSSSGNSSSGNTNNGGGNDQDSNGGGKKK